MTKRVSIPSGVDGIPTSSIPTDPQAFVTWFTSVYLKRWAANGDTRNAVATSASVQITGSLNTPAGIGIGPNSLTNGELVQRAPLSVMGNPTGVEANVQDIAAPADGDSLQRIAGALVWAPVAPTISTADSITGLGTALSPLTLVNDSASPGNSEYYGTSAAGALGYHALSGGSAITTLTQAGGASQVYNIPASATTIGVILIGQGGGGGSGVINASGSASGGGGGGSGAISVATYRAADLGASQTVTFTTTTGGTGGAAKTATGVGNSGTAGAQVQFGNLLCAAGGGGGHPGATGSASAGGAGATPCNFALGIIGGAGANGSVGNIGQPPAIVTSGYNSTGACSGAAGGGVSASTGQIGGVGGGASFAGGSQYNLAGGSAGALNSNGGNGNAGSGTVGGTGGGGGGGGSGLAPAGTGGNGGNFGGGGGGGGSSGNAGSANSGAGGNGGSAACIIIAW